MTETLKPTSLKDIIALQAMLQLRELEIEKIKEDLGKSSYGRDSVLKA